MVTKTCFLVSFLFFVCHSGHSQDALPEKKKRVEWNGYIKQLQSTFFIQKLDSNFSSNLIHNRINLKANLSAKLSVRFELRNRIFYGEQIKMLPDFGKIIDQNVNPFKLSKIWLDQKSVVIHSVIDRFLLRYSLENWDFKIGRQRINWGINNIWNPNDIFNAYNFLDFDYEERPGSDAIRIQRFFKKNTFLEFAYKPAKKKDQHTAAVLFGWNKWKYDFQVLSGIFQTDFFVGSGWAGSIKQIGFKGEMTLFKPVFESGDTVSSFSFSTMLDRTFKNEWYASVGGLFNSNPTNELQSNGTIYGSTLTAKLLFPFRYNFYATAVKSFSPITALNLTAIYSPEKNTLLIFPSFVWSVASNFDLTITAQSFFAQKSSAYAHQASGFYIRGKWSF